MALYTYGFSPGEGLYTDMNAIRRDEDLDELHSLYVDQRDREAIIAKSDRSLETLKAKVWCIYDALKATEDVLCKKFSSLRPILPETIHFITTQELEDLYPTSTPKELSLIHI